ncbi:S8 family serine peptidase (plasmid) [Streptomyces viridifaciens]|nr:S8 family serine peptidase [Streptomyces viridifaciens]
MELPAGLMYAMWCGHYDLINASLTTAVSHACDATYGRSIDYLATYCRRNSGVMVPEVPVLVAAAGNGSGNPSGYPARMRGAIVALATDLHSQAQPYNSTPPAQAITQYAYGGSATDPLGNLNPLTRVTGAGASLWGTSLAAPVVSGAYLPP